LKKAYISIGSNLGDRLEYLKKAWQLLQAREEIRLMQLSSCYETEPLGYTKQGKFINAVFSLKTSCTPHALLAILQGIESALGRERTVHWGPRSVDLDILFYADAVLQDSLLTIPHPRLTERAFVLVPLAEIAPLLVHPLTGKTVRQHLEEVEGRYGVVKLNAERSRPFPTCFRLGER